MECIFGTLDRILGEHWNPGTYLKKISNFVVQQCITAIASMIGMQMLVYRSSSSERKIYQSSREHCRDLSESESETKYLLFRIFTALGA